MQRHCSKFSSLSSGGVLIIDHFNTHWKPQDLLSYVVSFIISPFFKVHLFPVCFCWQIPEQLCRKDCP